MNVTFIVFVYVTSSLHHIEKANWLLREVHLFRIKQILNDFFGVSHSPIVSTIIVQLNVYPG